MHEEITKLVQAGQFDEALQMIDKLAEDDPKKHNLLGLVYFNRGMLDKAKESFEKGLSRSPTDCDLLFNYGYVLKELGNDKETWRYLMRIPNKDWTVYDLLGDTQWKMGNLPMALRYYKRAAELSGSEEMKKKFESLQRQARRNTKIAFLCLPGLDNFLKDIVETLSLVYDVKLVVSTDGKTIVEAIRWADIVWLEWANELAVEVTRKVPELSKKKVVCRLHRYEAFTNFPEHIDWSKITKLIFVAEHMMELFSELHPNLHLDSSKLCVVHNGVDLDRFKFAVYGPGHNLAVVAHINHRKEPALWVQVIAKLKNVDENYKLHVAGDFQDPTYKVYFEHAIREAGLQNNLILHGWVNDVSSFLQDKNYLLSTSIHEGLPYNIAEAMARGIKPVILNYRGAKEQWPNELLFNTLDEAIEIITSNSYDSESYRRFVEENYPLETQILEICESILSSASDRRLFSQENKQVDAIQSDKQDSSTTWGKIWKNYNSINPVQLVNDPSGLTLRSEFVRLLNDFFLIKGASFLEVGCGTAQFAVDLVLRGARYTGVDIEEDSIKLAKRIVQTFGIEDRCLLEIGDGFNLKYQNDSFDIVFNFGVLEHFQDDELIAMLKEMARVGKHVIVAVPYSCSQIYKFSKTFSQQAGTWEYGLERDFETLKQHFERAGLKLLHEEVIGFNSEVLYLKRVDPKAIQSALAVNLEKMFQGEKNIGSWLVAIGCKDDYHEELFKGLNPVERIVFQREGSTKKTFEYPAVSIVIPFLNGEKYVERLVKNLSELNYPNCEMVFVNDGSTDATEQLLQHHLNGTGIRYKLISLKENKGPMAARTEGIKASEGRYVLLHDIDDFVYKNGIVNMIKDRQNNIDGVMQPVSCALMKDGKFTGEIWYNHLLPKPLDYILLQIQTLRGKISVMNALFDRDIILAGHRGALRILEDLKINRINVGEDVLAIDYLLTNGFYSAVLPIYYTFRGYEVGNVGSLSKKIQQRIRDIPVFTAYEVASLLKQNLIDAVTLQKLRETIKAQARSQYGDELGMKFFENFEDYLNRFSEYFGVSLTR